MNWHELMVNLGASDNLLLVGSYADCGNYTFVLKERLILERYSVTCILKHCFLNVGPK